MNRTSLDFLIQMFPSFDIKTLSILVVNQTTEDRLLKSNFSSIKVLNSFEKGLSKSRNLALKNARKDILVITDDDLIYKPDFIDNIIKSFNLFTETSVLQFKVDDLSNLPFKEYSRKPIYKFNSFNCQNVVTFELVFKKEFLINNNIYYDEIFGLGSIYPLGEENIILNDILKKKGVISFNPITIVQHKKITSTDLIINTDKYFYLGAFYSRFSKENFWSSLLVKLFFDIKQGNVRVIEILSLLKNANKGKLDYERYR